MGGDLYDGLPVDRLPIDTVAVPEAAHLRRSDRYSGAMDIVVGYSVSMDRVLVVVLVPDGHPPGGLWYVATAWPADGRLRRIYSGKGREDG